MRWLNAGVDHVRIIVFFGSEANRLSTCSSVNSSSLFPQPHNWKELNETQ